MPKKELTVKQAAMLMDLKPSSVARLCRTGVLKATKCGRDWLIPLSSISEIDRRQRGNPQWGSAAR